jgi:regulatory protein
MGTITTIKKMPGRQKRAQIFVDGKPIMSLSGEILQKKRITEGTEIGDAEVANLAQAEQSRRCVEAATRLLIYRPRSEAELKKRLLQRKFAPDMVEATIVKMREQGLIDDAAFARFWTENREAFRPRSRRMTALELKQKGIDNEIIDKVVSSLDDEASAYEVALKKGRSLAGLEYETFRRRLGGFLTRRGFNYEITSQTLARLWQELQQNK